MAVYLIEVADDAADEVKKQVSEALACEGVRVRNLGFDDFKGYDWQEEYNAYMGAG